MRRRHSFGLLALALLSACRPEDQRTDTADPTEAVREREQLPAEVVAQLDSGSLAFRNDEFELARDHYQRAAELAPDFGAAWFGVFMAERALGNGQAADEALRQAQHVAPGASLIHPTERDTTR